MRKLWMAGALAAAALFARDVQAADEAAKERREAYDATKAEVKQEAREGQADTKREAREAKTSADQTAQETRDKMHDRTARAGEKGEKKHPVFEGKENFDLKGKIQKVSMNSITVARDELPAATLNVSKSTKIELDGQQASMKQLKAGQEVKASFNLQGAKAEAVEIKAEKMDSQKKAETK